MPNGKSAGKAATPRWANMTDEPSPRGPPDSEVNGGKQPFATVVRRGGKGANVKGIGSWSCNECKNQNWPDRKTCKACDKPKEEVAVIAAKPTVSAKQASAATAPKELSAEAPVFKLKQVASQQPSEAAEKYIDQEKEQLREKLRYSETIIMTLQTELEETRSMLAWREKELELEHKKAIEMLEHVVSRARSSRSGRGGRGGRGFA